MAQNLIELIEEQVFLNFTGRINILESTKAMYLGTILFEEGEIINAKLDQQEGFEALKAFFYFEFEKRKIKFIVEPELTSAEVRKIHFPFSVIRKKVTSFLQTHYIGSKKAPPRNIKVAINSNFLDSGQSLSSDEFDVLKVICDYNLIDDIYIKIGLPEHKVTHALVKLREKEAIRVIK